MLTTMLLSRMMLAGSFLSLPKIGYHDAYISTRSLASRVTKVESLGSDPVRAALESVHVGRLKVLLRNGADPNIPDALGEMPLHRAFFLSTQEIQLLLTYGACACAYDNNYKTPLMRLFSDAHVIKDATEYQEFLMPMLSVFIKSGVNLEVKDAGGKTVAQYVRDDATDIKNYVSAVRILRSSMPDDQRYERARQQMVAVLAKYVR